MFKRKFFNLILIIFSVIFFLLIFEIFTRSYFAIIKKDVKYFYYGFNKNINIRVNSISKLEFYINDSLQIEKVDKKNSLDNEDTDIMIFGGSTSIAYCPDSISWPVYLANKLNKNIINLL